VRIVVTNDDGIDSPGIWALARALDERGHDVCVVAPREDMSGVGAAIGRIRADQRIDTHPAAIPGAELIRALSIAGPPGLAVMAACLGAFGSPPELVISGINAGPNTGHACLHSGTVGAALTAATFGVSALAASAAVGDPMEWQTACALLDEPLQILAGRESPTVLNLNVPSLPPARVRGLRWTTLDRFGRVRVALAATSEHWLQMEYRANDTALDPDCDTARLEQGYATITAIEGIAEVMLDSEEANRLAGPKPHGTVTQIPESGA
jgi:5'-nucleotidase